MNCLKAGAIAVTLGLAAVPALAHHGWNWTTGGNIDLTGVVTEVDLGNPHGLVRVDVEGETWIVEVGQPWRMDRSGLKPGVLVEGVEFRAVGEPSLDPGEKRMKAEKFFIGGKTYILYPERD